MISSVNNRFFGKSQAVDSSLKQEEENEPGKVKKGKKQFVSQIEGKYYCTYLVDENGGKILLNKILATEAKNICSNDSLALEKLKNQAYFKNKNTDLNPQSHNLNVQGMLDILRSYAGLPNELECKHNLKG